VALDRVRRSARERAARIKFLYDADWDDLLLYDLALNTDRMNAAAAAGIPREALRS
jgi:cytidylate kinase